MRRPARHLLASAALACAWLAVPDPGDAPGAAQALRRFMVVRTPAIEELLRAGRIRAVDHYGPEGSGRVLVEGPRDVIDRAMAATPDQAPAREMASGIRLRDRDLDPDPARSLASGATVPGGHLEVVQLDGPPRPQWLAALRSHGVIPVSYLPHDAYIVWVEDGAPAPGKPVRWRQWLAPADRISRELAGREGDVDVTVQVMRSEEHDLAVDRILPGTRLLAGSRVSGGGSAPVTNLRIRVDAARLPEIAALAPVIWVEPFDPPSLHDERSAQIASGHVGPARPLGPGYAAFLAVNGLADLSAHVVDVTDTGIDTGRPESLHAGLRGRLAYVHNATPEEDPQDCAGHGTLMTGIIAGAGADGGGPSLRDADGYELGLGMAPSARVGSSRIFTCDGSFSLNTTFQDLLTKAWAEGARIGNNSWGGLGTQYNSVSAEFDALVRDVNRDPVDGDQGYLPVFSVGNFGPIIGTVGWPATAKNVLSVGATENYRPQGTDGCGASSLEADSTDHVLSFSSRGPSGDGRIKPDIVAPGSHIFGLASSALDYNHIGVCDPYQPLGQRQLTWATGTSEAAAHATGGAVIAAEIARRETGTEPSPALIKAMLINHAHDMMGTLAWPSNTGQRPNGDQGWGRMDIGSLVQERARVIDDQSVVLKETGGSRVLEPLVVEDAARPVIITLVWTDAPGTPGGWAWVNDLDLVVRAGGVTYLGNHLVRGVSVAGGSADERNNVEVVILPPGSAPIRVEVVASRLAGDGVPSVPGETDQDFALYASNARWPRGRAAISLPALAACGSPVTVKLSDAGLRGLGAADITLAAGADRETVRLAETPAGTGMFVGSVEAGAGPAVAGDGILQIDGTDTLTATSMERDDVTGATVARVATTAARCGPPVITNARVERVGDTTALVRWDTDRPATTRVTYTTPTGVAVTRGDARLVRRHEVTLLALIPCASYTLTASSTDALGRTGSSEEQALQFAAGAGTGKRRTLFRDDMERVVSRWTHRSLPSRPGTTDDWQLGIPLTGVPPAPSGSRVWKTRLTGEHSASLDAVLESPEIDLRGTANPQLAFWHAYSLAGGRSPTSANDGAWVEVSSDGGANWLAIDPAGGYPDSIDGDNPYIAGGSGVYAGALSSWARARFDLHGQAGKIIRIRFHVWHDEAETSPLLPGWAIDDVEVTGEGSCHEGTVLLDAGEYGCTSTVAVTLWDPDLNHSAGTVEAAHVTAEGPAGTLPLTLEETAASSGEFRGTLGLGAGPGMLAVQEGDSFSIRYDDAQAGEGPATTVASAVIPDCAPPPAPAHILAVPGEPGRLEVSWDPVPPGEAPDLQGYQIQYDTDAPGPVYGGSGALQGVSPVRSETIASLQSLAGLTPCLPHFVTVSAFDRLGNVSPFAGDVVAVPGSSFACAQGRIQLSPVSPACGRPLAISVLDSNADPDLASAGTVVVNVTSPTAPSPTTLTLIETGPATGAFTGSVLVARAPASGAIAAATGEPITVVYSDASGSMGSPRVETAQVTAGDCDPPVISQVRVTGRTSERAMVRWETDEPSTSRLRFGTDPSLPLLVEDPALVTQHAVPLADLDACSTVWYEVTSADAAGNAATQGEPGSGQRFAGWRDLPLFQDDLEGADPGWQHRSLRDSLDEWELGTPTDGPGPPPSGTHVWGTDLDGPYEDGADIVLISPPMDLGFREAITLSFMHWYDLYSSGAPDGFDDGAFVEISDDGGATWHLLQPLGGYPDRITGIPYAPFGSGAWSGRSPGWVRASFPLEAWAGRQVQLRFHLLEDPLELSVTRHSGWYLDDIRVSFSVACREAVLSWERSVYGCGSEPARLRLMDQDLDTPGADTVSVTVRSQGDPAGESVVLDETPGASGVFEGQVLVSPDDVPGRVKVIDGDTLVALYHDADDGTGISRDLESTASIGDCLPPELTNVRLLDRSPDSFRIAWDTSEPADSRVLYGPDDTLGLSVIEPALTRHHDLRVSGLTPCTTMHVVVASADALGNLAIEAASGPARLVPLPAEAALLTEDFATGAPSWTHEGEGDTWIIDAAEGGLARTASGSYGRPPYANALFSLTSPGFDLSQTHRPTLVLRHAWDFPASFQGGDGGWVEGWNGRRWVILLPEEGYVAWIDPEAGQTGERLRGFGGHSGGFRTSRFDLSPLMREGGRDARVRLRVFVEQAPNPVGAGWTIDQARITSELGCSEGRVSFDPMPITCARDRAGILLLDPDLDVTPSADTAVVTVDSSGGGPTATVTLAETGPSTGQFRAEALLDPSGSDAGSPRAVAGDILTLRYEDADDGLGGSASRVSQIEVAACAPPVLRSLTASQSGSSTVTLSWITDQPATSHVTLTPDPPGSAPALSTSSPDLVTSHRLTLRGLVPCTSYRVSATSTGVTGISGTDGLEPPLGVETIRSLVLFHDDMEGPDPGWSVSGTVQEWQRGIPHDDPGAAFSGQNVWGTDLGGPYDAGTDATLTTPPIDLRSVTSARLTFWHWYDVFGNESPNSLDDAAWVEVQLPSGTPVYIEPIGGYPDASDQEAGRPLTLGKPVYAGISEDWEHAEFDLTPFTGQIIRLRFRLWNDQVELLINGRTGAGWTIDDVEVAAPRFCSPPPGVTSLSVPRVAQGTEGLQVTIDGTGFREGAVATLGPGVTLSPITLSPTRLTCALTAALHAPLGSRDLTVVLPDRQTATLPAALEIIWSPARSDIDASGRVDALDLAALAAAFGSLEGQARFRAEADLNGDGAVDGLDLALLASSYGKTIE